MTQALIDSDLVAYRCAAASENDPLDIAILRADNLMRDILEVTQANSYLAALTGSNNFRKEINPQYKANRKDKVPPVHLQAVREFLVTDWNAIVSDGYEADDILGMYQDTQGHWEQGEHSPIYSTIIVSIDKDLLQVPGRHYNFVKNVFLEVDELTGLRSFYKQALIGDRSDNIFGVEGIGPVKAGKFLDDLTHERDMYNTVCQLYKDVDRLEMNLDCLWIMRQEDERWSERFAY